jgi:hypothetical protein
MLLFLVNIGGSAGFGFGAQEPQPLGEFICEKNTIYF